MDGGWVILYFLYLDLELIIKSYVWILSFLLYMPDCTPEIYYFTLQRNMP